MLRAALFVLAVMSIQTAVLPDQRAPQSASQSVDEGWVTVGLPGNPADLGGLGAVACEFQIMKFEVMVSEYTEFLNCVAAQADPHQLWVRAMGEHVITDLGQGGIRKDVPQCILREGSAGNWKYRPVAERENCPVFFVSFFSALRYANWLHNGRYDGDTEKGAYDLAHGASVQRTAAAKVWLPSEDEWVKAAYFQPEEQGGPVGNYWQFPMSTMQRPVKADPGSELPNAACFSKGFSGIAPVGSYPNAKSPWGALDMGGNVWEWTDSTIYETNRVLRGGSSPHNWEKLQANVRSNASPDRWYPDTGFRLARRIEK